MRAVHVRMLFVRNRWMLALRGLMAVLFGVAVCGCRPIELLDCLPDTDFRIDYAQVITRFGVPSEVVVASKRRV